METTLLTTDKDPMGAAIADYFNHHKANRLQVFSALLCNWQTEVFSTLAPEVVAMPSLFRKWGKKYVLSTFLRCL